MIVRLTISQDSTSPSFAPPTLVCNENHENYNGKSIKNYLSFAFKQLKFSCGYMHFMYNTMSEYYTAQLLCNALNITSFRQDE